MDFLTFVLSCILLSTFIYPYRESCVFCEPNRATRHFVVDFFSLFLNVRSRFIYGMTKRMSTSQGRFIHQWCNTDYFLSQRCLVVAFFFLFCYLTLCRAALHPLYLLVYFIFLLFLSSRCEMRKESRFVNFDIGAFCLITL